MKAKRALIGSEFGYLTVVDEIPNQRKRLKVMCSCRCGKMIGVNVSNLVQGYSTSCGCRRTEVTRQRSLTHGLSKTRTYKIWVGVLMRAEGLSNPESYLSRGIGVCDRWRDFEEFFKDMGPCPCGMSIDRIDNTLGYSENNCRWATATTQARNRRNTLFVEVNGVQKKLADLAEEHNIPYNFLHYHNKRGMKFQKILQEFLLSQK